MLLESLIISVLIGILRGGRLSSLKELQFKGLYLVFLSLLIEYLLYYLITGYDFMNQQIVFFIVLVQYFLLFLFAWLNKRYRYDWLLGLGIFLNFLVICFNMGSMPVSSKIVDLDGVSKKFILLKENKLFTYHILNDSTKLSFLGDILYIPFPYRQFISFGDILLVLGIFFIIQNAMLGKRKYPEEIHS